LNLNHATTELLRCAAAMADLAPTLDRLLAEAEELPINIQPKQNAHLESRDRTLDWQMLAFALAGFLILCYHMLESLQ
jgi:hypothetical protein